MFNVGGGELLIILVVALIVLGPQRLPQAARQVGRAMGEFRRISSGFQAELRDAMNEPAAMAAAPAPTPEAVAAAEVVGPEADPAGPVGAADDAATGPDGPPHGDAPLFGDVTTAAAPPLPGTADPDAREGADDAP